VSSDALLDAPLAATLDAAPTSPLAPPAVAPPEPTRSSAVEPACPSCGAPRPRRHCPECGEARVEPDDLTVRAFVAHAFEQFTNIDGALWRTVRTLVRHPGQLTADWLAGRRRGTARPLQLFVLANVLFFVLLSATGGGFRFRVEQYEHGKLGSVFLTDTTAVQAMVARKAAREGLTIGAYAVKFNAASSAQQSVWLLLAPTVAALLALLYARRRLPYVQHLVFAVHFLAFMLVTLATAIGGFGALLHLTLRASSALLPAGPALSTFQTRIVWASNTEELFAYPLMALLAVYLFHALRRVYPEHWGWTLTRTTGLLVVLPRLFDVYRDLLFAVTLATT
jgi:hypothetical protein